MKIVYNGAEVETSARRLAELLSEKGVDAASALVDMDGAVAVGTALARQPLRAGAHVEVFRLVSGG